MNVDDELKSPLKSLNTNSYISLGLVVTLILGIWKLSGTLSNIESSAALQNQRMAASFELLKSETALSNEKILSRIIYLETLATRDRWDYTEHYRWVSKLQQLNPAMNIPEPERPR